MSAVILLPLSQRPGFTTWNPSFDPLSRRAEPCCMLPAMERKTTRDFDQELLHLYDQYVHGGIDRRGFLDRAAKFAVGGVTAAMLLDQLSPQFAEAQQVKPDDGRVKTEGVSYPSPNGNGKM